MNVVIAGGGRTGAQLAALLVGQNHTVRLVEHRADILARIHRELPTEVIHEGDAADPAVLEAAGAREAQVLAACTPDDADNLALCFFARTQFRVPRTIARVNNPATAWLFNQTFGVDVALNQAEILSSLIEEEMSLGDMMTLLKIRRGRYSLVEEKILPGACPRKPIMTGSAGQLRDRRHHPQGKTSFLAEDSFEEGDGAGGGRLRKGRPAWRACLDLSQPVRRLEPEQAAKKRSLRQIPA
jgi:trk system potassium uptake protein TrkA